jgi:hypothetical protein
VIILADNHLHHQHRNIIATITAHGQTSNADKIFFFSY